MSDKDGPVFFQKIAYDALGNLRGETDKYRGTLNAYNDFGAGVVAFTLLVPAGAARIRVVAISAYSALANTFTVMDAAVANYPTQDFSGNLALGYNELGGGLIFTTSMVITPTANNLQFWASYQVEYDLDNM